jgi:hypothetical protein
MAKVTYGPLLTGLSGSVGNLTFSGQGNNAVMRSKPRGQKTFTDGQKTIFNLYHAAQIAYNNISFFTFQSIRNQITLFPKYMGNARTIDEATKALYCTAYVYSHLSNTFMQTTVLFDVLPAIASISSIQVSAGSIKVNFNRSFPSGTYPCVFLSRPQAKMINDKARFTSFMKVSDFSHSTWVNVYNSYITRFGVAPSVGQSIWASVFYLNKTTWQFTDTWTGFITLT